MAFASKEKAKAYYREYHRAYYLKHKAKILEKTNAWRKTTPKGMWYGRRRNWRKSGINVEEAEARLSAHDGRCEICGTTDSGGSRGGWCVDHQHGHSFVRGILCHRCNLTIGRANDSADLLRKMADYVESRSKSTRVA